MTAARYKTARCILCRDDRYLMVMHHNPWWWTRTPFRLQRWGLPGGRIEGTETPEIAVRREIQEELYIQVDALQEIDAYLYKGAQHLVFGSHAPPPVHRFDITEIAAIAWFSAAEIQDLERRGNLHAGFEARAIRDFQALSGGTADRSER